MVHVRRHVRLPSAAMLDSRPPPCWTAVRRYVDSWLLCWVMASMLGRATGDWVVPILSPFLPGVNWVAYPQAQTSKRPQGALATLRPYRVDPSGSVASIFHLKRRNLKMFRWLPPARGSII